MSLPRNMTLPAMPSRVADVAVYAVKFALALGVRAGTVPIVAFVHDTGGGKWWRSSGRVTSRVSSLHYTSSRTGLLLFLVSLAFLY